MPKTQSNWANRITGTGTENPADLLANPENWRIHPREQQGAMEAALDQVGWIQSVIVNQTTGQMIDGHLRVKLAMRHGETEIPVVYVALSEAEEKLALATFDPISGMAATDQEMLQRLIDDVPEMDSELEAMLQDLMNEGYEGGDDGGGGDDEGATAEAHGNLVDRFGAPPFSVLDARQGYWLDRKRAWGAIGIKSEVGRADDLTYAGTVKLFDHYKPNDGDNKGKAQPGTSIFDPVLCELSYRWFCPQGGQILDPFAGGSVRGIVAAWLGYKYTGIDLRGEQIEANRENWLEVSSGGADDTPAPVWIEGDSNAVLSTDTPPAECDFVFTCPPYGDLEVYSDDDADISNMGYDEFRGVYGQIIDKACQRLKQDRFAAIVIGDFRDKKGIYRNFVSHTIQAFIDAGLGYYNEAILVTPAGTLPLRAGKAFTASRKLGKSHQNVLVFVKGDPVKATKAIGGVYMTGVEESEEGEAA